MEINSQLSQWDEQGAVCLVTLRMDSNIITVYGAASANESNDYAGLAQIRALRLAHQITTQGLGAVIGSTVSTTLTTRSGPQAVAPIAPPVTPTWSDKAVTMDVAPADRTTTNTEPATTHSPALADEDWGEVVADEDWGGLLSEHPVPATQTQTPTSTPAPDQPSVPVGSDDDLALIIG